MIEIMMLMLLGNADALFDLQLEVDDQFEVVAELELKFEELQVERTATEIRMNVLFSEYKQYEKEEEWDNTKTRQEFVEFSSREKKNEWREEYRDLKVMVKEYKELEHEIETAKVVLASMEKDLVNLTKAKSNVVRYTDVSVSLSKNCKTMLKYDLYTNCPTIQELFDTFDNTDDTVSGVMVDDGFHDVQRVDIMKKHWKFYSDNQFTIWKNFKVTDNCKRILVAPDMELITQAIEFAINNCNGEVESLESVVVEQKTTPHDFKKWRDSPALVYQNWLKDAIANNKELRIGLD